MSAPKTGPEEFDRLRKEHKASDRRIFKENKHCAECYAPWPCTMSRALDQIEEMRKALETMLTTGAHDPEFCLCPDLVREALSLRHLVSGKGE